LENRNNLQFSVEIDTLDDEALEGTSMGSGLEFAASSLPRQPCCPVGLRSRRPVFKMPVYAPGVTDKSKALRIDLGLAEHRTGIEIKVPPEALKAEK